MITPAVNSAARPDTRVGGFIKRRGRALRPVSLQALVRPAARIMILWLRAINDAMMASLCACGSPRVYEQLTSVQAALTERYTVECEIGRGGMATVYLANDLKHHRRVAIKVLRPDIAAALGPERFLREIETAARLNHPHVLSLHDSGEVGGLLYYVMPYVEGETLRRRLDRERQLPLDGAVQITREVADALGYAHSLGVVHRDIKPENILFQAGHAVVSDFGIARAVAASGRQPLTATGIAVGTPAYMSPEQAAGVKELDGRSDLYSLGWVAYEMLVGEPPFTGPNAQAVVARHALDPVRSIRTVRKSVPAQVERALMKILEKVPADRFRTAAEFSAALGAADEAQTAHLSSARSVTAGVATLTTAVRTSRKPRDDEIDVYGLTHPGKGLTGSQDHFLICSVPRRVNVHLSSLPPLDQLLPENPRVAFLAMVADMHSGGPQTEQERRLSMETIAQYLACSLQCCYTADGTDEHVFAQTLEEAALRCHMDLLRRDPRGRGLATSLALWIGVWPRGYFLQVGDSRCYLLHEGELTQISRDRTMAQEFFDRGILARTDAQDTRLASGLSSAIGDLQSAPFVTRLDQAWNQVGVLCTDGLTKHISDERIGERLRSMTSAKQACEDLLRDALESSASDNISIAIGRTVKKDRK